MFNRYYKKNEPKKIKKYKFFKEFIKELKELKEKNIRTILYMIEISENNKIMISKEEISRKIGITKRTVYNHIKRLKEKEIIYEIETDYYMINPRMVYKGDKQKLYLLLKEYTELTGKKIKYEGKYYQISLKELLKKEVKEKIYYKLLFMFLAKMEKDNIVRCKIHEELDRNYYKPLNLLILNDLIKKVSEDEYMINPYIIKRTNKEIEELYKNVRNIKKIRNKEKYLEIIKKTRIEEIIEKEKNKLPVKEQKIYYISISEENKIEEIKKIETNVIIDFEEKVPLIIEEYYKTKTSKILEIIKKLTIIEIKIFKEILRKAGRNNKIKIKEIKDKIEKEKRIKNKEEYLEKIIKKLENEGIIKKINKKEIMINPFYISNRNIRNYDYKEYFKEEEIIELKTKKQEMKITRNFEKMDLEKYLELKIRKKENLILLDLIRNRQKSTNKVYINKKEINNKYKISKKRINEFLKLLEKEDIIKKVSKEIYIFNPSFILSTTIGNSVNIYKNYQNI